MTAPHTSLSGHWTGVYDYPGNKGQPVPFTAILAEREGDLTGDIDEPHLGLGRGEGRQSAVVSGLRSGTTVSFTKTYLTRRGHKVEYQGTVNEKLTKIEGTWSIVGNWSGPFVMNRMDPPVRQAEVKEKSTIGNMR